VTPVSLLEPGSYRAASVADEKALVAALLRTEVGWLRALSGAGVVKPEHVEAVETAVATLRPRLDPPAVEAAGNPAGPLVAALREAVRNVVADQEVATLVHRGLTSQDTLDTALMLLAQDALERVEGALATTATELARLADGHRGSVMAGRTLTQHAVPVTFGLKAAQWLVGVLDARDAVAGVRRDLPVQCGGAAGTLALAGDLAADPVQLAAAFADQLGLRWPGIPWHTRRTPVTRLGDVLVQSLDAVGVLAADVLLLGRPEIAEVREVPAPGHGGSSTMPHKQNPVLAVLVKTAALQGPMLAAQLHLSSSQSIDERPDGAWHGEWPALRRLLTLAVTASAQAAELVSSLDVDVEAMRRRAEDAAGHLLAERRREDPGPVDSYLGAAGHFVDVALQRFARKGSDHA
jgi:3-carboxy-cis,cis-muconate cycloisomerase